MPFRQITHPWQVTLRELLYHDEDINPKYSKVYCWHKKKKVADRADGASLWMDQPFMGLIHDGLEDPIWI